MATAQAWYEDNTMVVQLGMLRSLGDHKDAPLTDALTGTVITDATVQATLEDSTGVSVAGGTWPITIAHVSGGVYRGSASHAVQVQRDAAYVVVITATKAGNQAEWRLPVVALERDR